MKTVIIESIIAPYDIARFNRINERLNGDLLVLFQNESEKIRNWRLNTEDITFKYRVLPDIPARMGGKNIFTLHVNYTTFSVLEKVDPDVVISCGWDSLAAYMSYWYCRKYGRKYILWAGSTVHEPSWRRTLTLPLVRFLVRNSDAWIAYGTRAKEYLIRLGADENKISIGWNSVDNSYFEENSKMSHDEKTSMKSRLGIRTGLVILYVGRLTERKGVFDLLAAFSGLKKEIGDAALLLVGSGMDEPLLKKEIVEKGISDVIFAGFVDYDQLPKYFGISDLFVLPSYDDIWGLVINEAMACGLPVVTTNKVGASADLVKDGVNGFVVKEKAPLEIQNALRKIVSDAALRRKMAESSQRIIRDFGINETVEGLQSAIAHAFDKKRVL